MTVLKDEAYANDMPDMTPEDWEWAKKQNWDQRFRENWPASQIADPKERAEYEAYAARMKAAESAGKVLLPGMPPETK